MQGCGGGVRWRAEAESRGGWTRWMALVEGCDGGVRWRAEAEAEKESRGEGREGGSCAGSK